MDETRWSNEQKGNLTSFERQSVCQNGVCSIDSSFAQQLRVARGALAQGAEETTTKSNACRKTSS